MRINFKKVSAIAASVLMVGMTMIGGVAAAQSYPAPFVKGGVADVAIVYGTGSGYDPLDIVQAGYIQSNLQSHMGASDGSTTVTGGDSWQVGTSSDDLEIGEPINNVITYIGKEEFSLLTDETISNEKGDATYSQYFYWPNEDAFNSSVIYTEDDDDNIGLFLKFNSGKVIGRYVMDFSTNLKSDIETDQELSDIEDKMMTFLGKTYTITDATNGSSGVELTLMSGALGGKITEGTPVTLGTYTVTSEVSSSTAASFTITSASGTMTTDKMNKGEIEKLDDGSGNYIAVTDITYEGYADGDQSATIYIGADKIELKNGTSMTVNGETISDASVLIVDSESGSDLTISEIGINMTAEDDLFIPVGGKLSEATDLDEPQVLVSQNWDIQFEGLKATDYEDLSLKVSGSDKKYTLRYKNYNGDEVTLPVVYTNASGIFGGEDSDAKLVLSPNGTGEKNVTKKDYFLLHTANPTVAANNAKTVLVQYKGSDSITDSNPKARFTINPGTGQYDEEMALTQTDGAGGATTFTLKVAGGTFNFRNTSSAASDDFDIKLADGASFATLGDGSAGSTGNGNNSITNYIRTQYNTLITIQDMNESIEDQNGAGLGTDVNNIDAAPWNINVSVDDTNKDGDDFNAPDYIFNTRLGNTSTDASMVISGNTAWLTDPDNSDVQKYITRYGVDIVSTDPNDSPASIEVKVPKTIVNPLVYVTDKNGISVSTTSSTASTSLGEVLVTDSEISTVSSKNLIVVGGSCINSVAANLIGGAYCGSAWTEKTGVGSGEFLIKSYAGKYATGKIALLVAGYEAADTVAATTALKNKVVDTAKEYKGTTSTTTVTEVTAA